ncbi:MAG: alcohol dehydrogenase catalytic domain-containing protein [Candidatus Omnitrophica bacterium]|nr:alcohol dehydrogenase catalytic domain-containing protein [Candidatus Omnitrophota bacterium]
MNARKVSMKILLAKAPFRFKYEYREIPKPGRSEVLVRMKACGICATDFHNIRERYEKFSPLGHEGAGEVIRLGKGVTDLKPGDKVAISGGVKCNMCEACRKKNPRLCRNGPSVWRSKQMLFSEYAVLDRRLLFPFTKIDYQTAALLEPASVALELVKESELRNEQVVLVVGLGAIGLMAAQILKSLGIRVLGQEIPSAQASLTAAKKMGLEVVAPGGRELLSTACTRYSIRRIMITASPQTIPEAVEAIQFGGIITYIGLGQGGQEIISLDCNKLLRKKVTLKPVYAVPPLYPEESLRLLKSGIIDSRLIISHTFPFGKIPEAFKLIQEKKGETIKVMVEFEKVVSNRL